MYSAIIESNIENVYKTGIATKIIQHMDRVRNISDKTQARRWVMELLQNARDISYDEIGVDIKIVLENDCLRFMHNGKPFTVKNILAIINQVSSKTSDKNTIGKFGTGFVSTFQLSDRVHINSVIKDENLPYKKFSINIDRSPKEIDSILESINNTLTELKKVDEAPALEDFDPKDYNTEFVYILKNDRSREIAKIGMKDLENTIFYVMLFSKKINEITLVYNTNSIKNELVYKREEDTGEILEISEQTGSLIQYHKLFYKSSEDIIIAAPIENSKFLKIPETIPKIFVDFPLVGSENFPFPVIVNSKKFKPNEPRSGITLVDNESSQDAFENKKIIKRAIELYKEYILESIKNNFRKFENIISIPKYIQNNEISEQWIKLNLYKELFDFLNNQEIIFTKIGYTSLSNESLYLIDPKNTEKEELKNIIDDFKDVIYPEGEENFLQAFSGYEENLPKSKIITIENILKNSQKIVDNVLDTNKITVINWCIKTFNTAVKNYYLKTKIMSGEYSIFISQSHEEKNVLKTRNQLNLDPGIPEKLKDICEELDKIQRYYGDELINIRKVLLHKEFQNQNLRETGFNEFSESIVEHYISKKIEESELVSDYYRKPFTKAIEMMVSIGPDEEIYNIVKEYGKFNLQEYNNLKYGNIRVWDNSYKQIFKFILDDITCYEKIDDFTRDNDNLQDSFYPWYSKLLQLASDWIKIENLRIFPNQKDRFCKSDKLYLDIIKYEELKEISQKLAEKYKDCEIYEILLNKNLKYTVTMPGFTDKNIAQNISTTISKIFSKNKTLADASEMEQNICTQLLAFIEENEAEAQNLFPAFSGDEDKMKLLTPKSAVNMRKEIKNGKIKLKTLEEENKILKAKLQENQGIGKLGNTIKDVIYNSDYDVILDSEFLRENQNLNKEQFEEMIREIGKNSELLALEYLKNKLKKEGFELIKIDKQVIYMHKEEIQLQIIYKNSETYCQPGYDIEEIIYCENKKISTRFYEVKGNTSTSIYKNTIKLSDEQMKKALKETKNYTIINVIYDYKNKTAKEYIEYENPTNLIVEGRFRNLENKYIYKIS